MAWTRWCADERGGGLKCIMNYSMSKILKEKDSLFSPFARHLRLAQRNAPVALRCLSYPSTGVACASIVCFDALCIYFLCPM